MRRTRVLWWLAASLPVALPVLADLATLKQARSRPADHG